MKRNWDESRTVKAGNTSGRFRTGSDCGSKMKLIRICDGLSMQFVM